MKRSASGRTRAGREWAEHRATSRVLSGKIVSFANLVRSPVIDTEQRRIGRLNDVVVRWESGDSQPAVTSIVVRAGRARLSVSISDIDIEHDRVHLRSSAQAVAVPREDQSTMALARDVLDHQLVDVAGVEVVRCADVYLSSSDGPWHIAGIDVSQWAYWRRILPRRPTSPLPRRAVPWSDVQAFIPRFVDAHATYADAPAASAGVEGSNLQLLRPAKQLHTLRALDVAVLLGGLSREHQGQLSRLIDDHTVAQALRDLDPKRLATILANINAPQRARIEALLHEDPA